MNEIDKTQIEKLNGLHGEILESMRSTVYKAVEAGEILQQVKETLPHGEFTGWVEENVNFNLRTAQRYMKAYSRRELLKSDTVSSLKQLIEEPKDDSSKMIERLNDIKEKVKEAARDYKEGDEVPRLDNKLKEDVAAFIAKCEDYEELTTLQGASHEIAQGYGELALKAELIIGQLSQEIENSFADLLPDEGERTIVDFMSDGKDGSLSWSEGIVMLTIDRHVQEGYYILNAYIGDTFGNWSIEGTKRGLNADGALKFINKYMTKEPTKVGTAPAEPLEYNDTLFENYEQYKRHTLGV